MHWCEVHSQEMYKEKNREDMRISDILGLCELNDLNKSDLVISKHPEIVSKNWVSKVLPLSTVLKNSFQKMSIEV